MADTYRESALVCPACAARMDPRHVCDAVIDACPECAAIWIDWFDGELVPLVAEAPPAIATRPVGAFDLFAGGCPRCQRPLDPETIQRSTETLYRCAECVGVLVPRSAFDAVLRATVDPPPASPLEKLKALITSLLG